MTQFTARRQQSPRPDTYRRLARLVRGYADRLEAHAEGLDARDKQARTTALKGLYQLVRDTWRRHQGYPPVMARESEHD